MKEWINLLDIRERKIAGVLCLLLAAALLFLAFVLLKERTTAGRAQTRLRSEEQNLRILIAQRDEAQRDFRRWQDALHDMQELKDSYFYEQKSKGQNLQLDLQQIFAASGINMSQIKYEYSDFTKEGIEKVDAGFTISGSYAALKNFLETIETRPKFLFVEKIAFSQIAAQGGPLELRVNLAGYYER
jgi:Tfp pilus assembly protein PilO